MEKTSTSWRLFMKHKKSSQSIVLLALLTFALILNFTVSSALARDYDFSLVAQDPNALKVNPGDEASFLIDFKNEGTLNDSYMFSCGKAKTGSSWDVLGCFDLRGTCWGTSQLFDFSPGGTELADIHIYTNTDLGTYDFFLKVTSQATGIAKIVYMTASNETSPAIRPMIYTNLDSYSVGDTINVNLRIVNLGDNQNADTYVAFIHGEDVYWYKRSGELSKIFGPYSSDQSYETTFVNDKNILSVPIEAPIGLDYLIIGTVMAKPGTTEIISDISTVTITFK
jgi:hypothetical protein